MSSKSEFKGMVDVGQKSVTKRSATACAHVCLGKKAYQHCMTKGSPKGDIFEAARVAGLLAAKATPQWVPHCHPLKLNKVNIRFEFEENKSIIKVISEVKAAERTGVEMEALCAVSAAALTIYDMLKFVDKGIVISSVMLLKKSGGKSGSFTRKK